MHKKATLPSRFGAHDVAEAKRLATIIGQPHHFEHNEMSRPLRTCICSSFSTADVREKREAEERKIRDELSAAANIEIPDSDDDNKTVAHEMEQNESVSLIECASEHTHTHTHTHAHTHMQVFIEEALEWAAKKPAAESSYSDGGRDDSSGSGADMGDKENVNVVNHGGDADDADDAQSN